MNSEFPSADLNQIIAEVYLRNEESLTTELHFEKDLGGDSLKIVELVMSIELRMGVDLPDRDIGQIETVGQLRKLVQEQWEDKKVAQAD